MFVEGGLQFFNEGLKLCGILGVHTLRAQFADAVFQPAGGHKLIPAIGHSRQARDSRRA